MNPSAPPTQQDLGQALLLQHLLDRTGDGVVVLDPDQRVQVWNAAMERLTLTPAAEALDRPLHQVWPRMREAGVAAHVAAALRGQTAERVPLGAGHAAAPDPCGALECTIAPVLTTAGRPRGVMLIVRASFDPTEITALRRGDEEARRRQDLAFDVMRAATWTWNIDRDEAQTDQRTREVLGAGPKADIRSVERFLAVVHPDDRERIRANLRRAADTGCDVRHEYRTLGADGAVRWIVSCAKQVRNADGTRSLLGTAWDHTALHEAREQARAAGQQADLALEAAGMATWTYDFNARVYSVSPTMAAMLGHGHVALTMNDEQMTEALHPDCRAEEAADVRSALADPQGRFATLNRVKCADGSYIWLRCRGRVERDAHGAPIMLRAVTQDVTAQRALEVADREKAALLTMAAQAGRIAPVCGDIATGIVTHGPELLDIMGLPHDHPPVTRQQWRATIHPDDLVAAMQRRDHQLATGVVEYRNAYRLLLPDGRIRWVRVVQTIERDASGTPLRLMGVVSDMSDVHEARRAAQDWAVSVNLMQETGASGTWRLTAEGVFAFDAGFAAIMGLPGGAGSMSLDALVERIHPDARQHAIAGVKETFAGRAERVCIEHRVMGGDGRYRHLRCHGLPEHDERGGVIAIRGASVDRTTIVESEASALQAQRRVALAVEAAGLGEWTWNLHTNIVSCNPRLVELFGFPAGTVEAPPDQFYARMHPDDLPGVRAASAVLGQGTDRFDTPDYRVVHPDGSVRWLRTVGRSILDASGNPTGDVTGLTIDITESRRALESLERSNESLESLVRARTAELSRSHEQLRVSERMAAVGLGHDLGNLLLPIRCDLDVLRAAHAGAESVHRVDSVRRSIDYLARLSHSLRMLALDPDEQGGENTGITIDEWWRSAEPLLRGVLPKGVVFEAKIHPGLPAVRPGGPGLSQSVLNLLLNAAEALRDVPSPRVQLVAAQSVADGGAGGGVELQIIDNGIGMTEHVRRRATEPFFTTKPRALSTGLGLSLVESIVRGVGGGLSITSTPGRGTSVSMVLPGLPGPGGARAGTAPAAGATTIMPPHRAA
ncbi:MAG: PAS domain-containing protein [Phycisphaerales bacterium]